jgi:hypothetical protein
MVRALKKTSNMCSCPEESLSKYSNFLLISSVCQVIEKKKLKVFFKVLYPLFSQEEF